MTTPSMKLLAAAGGAPPFDPLSLSPTFWFDAADASTIAEVDVSGRVSTWSDKSGNDYHVTGAAAIQPVTGTHTQNGRNVLTWSGDYYLTHDAGSDVIDLAPLSLFAVAYSSAPDVQFRRLVSARRSATGSQDFQSPNLSINDTNSTSVLQANIAANGVQITSGYPTWSATTWTLFRYGANASGVSIAIDGGTPVTTAGTATIGAMRYLRVGRDSTGTGNPPGVGGLSAWAGRIAEMIAYPADLTADEIADVENYLTNKWGL